MDRGGRWTERLLPGRGATWKEPLRRSETSGDEDGAERAWTALRIPKPSRDIEELMHPRSAIRSLVISCATNDAFCLPPVASTRSGDLKTAGQHYLQGGRARTWHPCSSTVCRRQP
uniref:Uncharacterized protein n=1 Tax=Oryza nivara TaxID=4536 RepID=A0A0E0I0N7_ORYNI